MKYLKIFLAFLAAIGIGLAVYFGFTKTTTVEEIDRPENQFTRRVNQEIIDISNKPESRFCKDAYDIVKYHIEDYASMNKLGVNLTDSIGNQINQQAFLRTLYSTYADKFIAQANQVFRGNEWTHSDLSFIKDEAIRIRSYGKESGFLEVGSAADKDFSRISRIVNSYYSEVGFINDCKSFSYNQRELDSRFPIKKAQSIINDSKKHLSSLGVVKNSDVVREGLSSIPDKVFSVHVTYLSGKLNEWEEMYIYYATLAAYKSNLYDNLRDEISQLKNPMYSSLNTSAQITRLMNSLDADYRAASLYFQNK